MLLISGNAFCQNGISLMSRIEGKGNVVVKYSISGKNETGNVVFRQSGSIDVKRDRYKLTASGLEIFCNGKSMWVYSPESEELVIYSADKQSSNPAENPLLFLKSSCVSENKDGKSVISYTDIDGKIYTIIVSDIKEVTAEWPDSHFEFNMNSASEDLIITDLRDE